MASTLDIKLGCLLSFEVGKAYHVSVRTGRGRVSDNLKCRLKPSATGIVLESNDLPCCCDILPVVK